MSTDHEVVPAWHAWIVYPVCSECREPVDEDKDGVWWHVAVPAERKQCACLCSDGVRCHVFAAPNSEVCTACPTPSDARGES